MRLSILALLSFILFANLSLVHAETKEADRLEAAAKVFQESMETPDRSVPTDLLERCECLAIIPSMKKGGFILGGRYGKGVVSCRQDEGKGPWGPPAMIARGGGSFGVPA